MEYLFIALIPIVAVAILVIVAIWISSHTFRCNHCFNQFQIKWFKVIVTEHCDNEYMLVCPHCKTKDWCTEQTKRSR